MVKKFYLKFKFWTPPASLSPPTATNKNFNHFESAEVLPATKGNAPVDLTILYQARSSCSAATEGRKLARELVEVWGELQHS